MTYGDIRRGYQEQVHYQEAPVRYRSISRVPADWSAPVLSTRPIWLRAEVNKFEFDHFGTNITAGHNWSWRDIKLSLMYQPYTQWHDFSLITSFCSELHNSSIIILHWNIQHIWNSVYVLDLIDMGQSAPYGFMVRYFNTMNHSVHPSVTLVIYT